jgi:hypothetical protein
LKFSGEKLKFAGEKKSIHLGLRVAIAATGPGHVLNILISILLQQL